MAWSAYSYIEHHLSYSHLAKCVVGLNKCAWRLGACCSLAVTLLIVSLAARWPAAAHLGIYLPILPLINIFSLAKKKIELKSQYEEINEYFST